MMKNKKYKILVLSELNKSLDKILKSSVSLAKIVNSDINFFYVKKPTDVVEKESQLSAMRTINKEYFSIDFKLKELIDPISNRFGVKINHSFTIGNVKNEIEKYIDENQPDIIILGKRKSKILKFMGDNITEYILKKHKGTIVITDDKNTLEPNKELSLGLFNSISTKNSFTQSIINATQKPLTSFKILEKNINNTKEEVLNKKTVEYVFEKSDDVIKNISSYLSKSNINLLFINRENSNINPTKTKIKDVINNLDCSLILTT